MRNNEEYEEQKVLVQYMELMKIKFTAITNSTYTNIGQRVRNKMMGLRAGLPDLFLIIKNKPLFIEMKKKKNGNVSDVQKEWIKSINNCEGIKAYVCEGFDEAKKVIDLYLK